MNIHRNSIGVEISPSVMRIASLHQSKGALHLSATGETRLSYQDFDDLYQHPKECGNALDGLCSQNGIHSGRCIAMLPAAQAKSKCVALPLMRRRALLRMLSSRHFWHKHLGVGSDNYRYAWLTTIHDKKQYRLSIYLMAVLADALAFYTTLFAHTRLSLNVLTLSSLAYYGMHRTLPARRLLVLTENELYLAHLGENVFSHQTALSDYDHNKLFGSSSDKTPCDAGSSDIALQHLSESLHERLRSEKGDNHTLHWVGSLSRQAITRLESSLNDITLKPLDVCENVKLAPSLQNVPAAMSAPIALARWLESDSETLKSEANFIHDPTDAYYKSAACWVLSMAISVILFFYHQHIAGLNAIHQPQLLYQEKLSAQQDEYKNKLNATKQRTESRQQIQTQMQFLAEKHHLAMDLWSRLGALIPQSIKIESIDCRWQSACLIAAVADDYGQVIQFAEQIKQLDAISEIVIDSSSRTTLDQADNAMQFMLTCKLNNKMEE